MITMKYKNILRRAAAALLAALMAMCVFTGCGGERIRMISGREFYVENILVE